MTASGRFARLRPSYMKAGLRASGTAADLRRLIFAGYRFRNSIRAARNHPDSGNLRVLVHIPTYLPHHRGGAERSMEAVVRHLHVRGHSVTIVIDTPPQQHYVYEGVTVHARPRRRTLNALYRTSDAVLSQKSASIRSQLLAARHRKPFVMFVRDIGEWRKLPGHADLLVFNARWQRDMFGYRGNSLVVYPPIDPAMYETTPGSHVTLVNLNERKGARLFLEVVRLMPETDFLAVTSVWGDSITPTPCPPNLRVVEPTNNMREIYSQTRILLAPSKWESFGRVAVEAALSGIPVISSPNPGTFEAMGNAAIYADRSEPHEWVSAIRSLENHDVYARRSEDVRARARQLCNRPDLATLEGAIAELVADRVGRAG